jgi:hypothetical protein
VCLFRITLTPDDTRHVYFRDREGEVRAKTHELPGSLQDLCAFRRFLQGLAVADGGLWGGTPERVLGCSHWSDTSAGFVQEDAHIFCTPEQVWISYKNP